VVAGHGLGAHGAELPLEAGPELLQAHPSTLTRGRHPGVGRAYARSMIPGTGNETLDIVLQLGIVLALIVTVVLLIRNFRNR
jgi:hypothetical protein